MKEKILEVIGIVLATTLVCIMFTILFIVVLAAVLLGLFVTGVGFYCMIARHEIGIGIVLIIIGLAILGFIHSEVQSLNE